MYVLSYRPSIIQNTFDRELLGVGDGQLHSNLLSQSLSNEYFVGFSHDVSKMKNFPSLMRKTPYLLNDYKLKISFSRQRYDENYEILFDK